MKVSTLSIVCGTSACDASCPYCISKITGTEDIPRTPAINYVRLRKACQLAENSGATTVLLTGKGEPTLYMDQIFSFLNFLQKTKLPIIELQTNGIELSKNPFYLDELKLKGLDTICLSIVHWNMEKNAEIFTNNNKEKYIDDLCKLILQIHNIGLSVRLSCIMLNGYIDSFGEVVSLINFARDMKVEQVTIRPVFIPNNFPKFLGAETCVRIQRHCNKLSMESASVEEIHDFIKYSAKATKLLDLPHGGIVYDFVGQNLCFANCLTESTDPENMRQFIYFPDGHLRYSWQYPGAILF